MKLTTKWAPILILLLLASPVILLNGCGENHDSSGACSGLVAPSGAKITKSGDLDAPTIGVANCYTPVSFTITDSADNPMNGICAVIITNASIALTTANEQPPCNNVAISASTQIITTTDKTGSVILDLVTQPTTSGQTFFVEASSGALSAVVKTAGAKTP